MEHIAQEIAGFLGQWFPPEVCAFLISMLPIFELRGGLIAAGVGSVSWPIAFLICVISLYHKVP